MFGKNCQNDFYLFWYPKQFFFRGAGKSSRGGAAKGSPPARSGLTASTAGEEPGQDPARNWLDTGKKIAYFGFL